MLRNRLLGVGLAAAVALSRPHGGAVVQAAQFEPVGIRAEYREYCREIGEMYGIRPTVLMAMVEAESGGDPHSDNGEDKGLMQIRERYAGNRMARLGVTDIFDPYSNILLGADTLYSLRRLYGNDLKVVLGHYNGQDDVAEQEESGKWNEYQTWILERAMELGVEK